MTRREMTPTERAEYLAKPLQSHFDMRQRGKILPHFTPLRGGRSGLKRRSKGLGARWLYSFDNGKSWSDSVIEAVDRAMPPIP